jgi:hypothetical protein
MALNQQSVAIPASGSARLPQGNFFFLLSAAPGAVTVNVSRGGQNDNFANAIAGLKIERVVKWDYIDLVGAAGTVVNYLIGFVTTDRDTTDVQQALATIAGTVAVAILPSGTINDVADTVQAFGTQTVIAANLARRRITIGNRETSVDTIRVSGSGGAGKGIVIQAGTFAEFDTTASLTVRNDNAAGNATWYSFEEV